MKKSELIDKLKIEMKRHKFRKKGTTWRKDFGEVIAVFNVQSSQWNSADYFINVGVYLKCLGDHKLPPEYKCHVRSRLQYEIDTIEVISSVALKWFEERSTISGVKKWAEADSSHGLVSKAVRELRE